MVNVGCKGCLVEFRDHLLIHALHKHHEFHRSCKIPFWLVFFFQNHKIQGKVLVLFTFLAKTHHVSRKLREV
jgi:hypothetical protein